MPTGTNHDGFQTYYRCYTRYCRIVFFTRNIALHQFIDHKYYYGNKRKLAPGSCKVMTTILAFVGFGEVSILSPIF